MINKKVFSNINLIKRIKTFFKTKEFNVTKKIPQENILTIKNFIYKTKPFNLYINVISIFGNSYIFPGVSSIHPGYLIFKKVPLNFKNTFLNMMCFLKIIPYDMLICYVKNKLNNK
jgi:hypothetical protein